jgi:hypothetical protein
MTGIEWDENVICDFTKALPDPKASHKAFTLRKNETGPRNRR